MFNTRGESVQVMTSPMLRCLMTCRHVAAGLGCTNILVEPTLYESTGCYEHQEDGSTRGNRGLTSQEIQDQFAGFVCPPSMENGWYDLEGMESFEHFKIRAAAVGKWIWSLHDLGEEVRGYKNLVIVCHGNLMSAVLSELTKSSSLTVHKNTAYCQVQLLSYKLPTSSPEDTTNNFQNIAVLLCSNRADHLAPHLMIGDEVENDHWIQEYVQYM